MKRVYNNKTGTAFILIGCICMLFNVACTDSWLEAKPDKALVLPRSLKDYQSLLDNTAEFNNLLTGGLGEVGAGDFLLSDNDYLGLASPLERNVYVWKKENVYEGEPNPEWSYAYERILKVNIVLEGLDKITRTGNEQQWDHLRGSALFFRALDYFNLAQLFCQPYTGPGAATALGLPLRLNANVNEKKGRSNLDDTYGQIISDLEDAYNLLPSSQDYKTRPNKVAADGLLARIYLSTGNYERALFHSNRFLLNQEELIDYNDLNINANFPIAVLSDEVVFHGNMIMYTALLNNRHQVSRELFDSYETDDLRRNVFFASTENSLIRFKGSYAGSRTFFVGIATDEQYLIKAECLIRQQKIAEGLTVLNKLLRTRWKKGAYIDFVTDDVNEALHFVLQERRKQLLARGVRWSDLRRLNVDPRFEITLNRTLSGMSHVLSPNDPRYVLPIPDEEMLNNPMEQNPR